VVDFGYGRFEINDFEFDQSGMYIKDAHPASPPEADVEATVSIDG